MPVGRRFGRIFAAAMLIGLGIPSGGRAEMTLADIFPADAKPEVIGSGYHFCEGPTPDARGNVYFSDGDRNSIYFYEIGKPVRLFVGDSPGANGQKINAKGELYTCEGTAFRVVAFNLATKTKARALPGDRRPAFQRAQRPGDRPPRRLLLHRSRLHPSARQSADEGGRVLLLAGGQGDAGIDRVPPAQRHPAFGRREDALPGRLGGQADLQVRRARPRQVGQPAEVG